MDKSQASARLRQAVTETPDAPLHHTLGVWQPSTAALERLASAIDRYAKAVGRPLGDNDNEKNIHVAE